MSFRRARLCPQ